MAEVTAQRRREAQDAVALLSEHVRAKIDAEERRNGALPARDRVEVQAVLTGVCL